MKIIHCADMHLDSKMTANLTKEQARERKGEILRTFSKMVEYAKNHQVSAIIIAGDMFDTARITNLTKTRVLNTITKNVNIDFLYFFVNNWSANPKDCHYINTSIQYVCGTSSGECSLLMSVFFVV